MSLTQERINEIAIEIATHVRDIDSDDYVIDETVVIYAFNLFLSRIREEQGAAAEVFFDSYPDHTATMYVTGQFLKDGTKLFTIPPAAPYCKELVEALEEILDRIKYDKDASLWWPDAQRQARDALAKHKASMGGK